MSNVEKLLSRFPVPLIQRAVEMIGQAAAGERLMLNDQEALNAMMVAMGALLACGGDAGVAIDSLQEAIFDRSH